MPLFGSVVVIRLNGTDGMTFPLTARSCLFGRRLGCDIRMPLPWISDEHCKIEINENKEAILTNLSTVNPTQLNGSCFQQPVPLKHGDLLTVVNRSFRFEYPLQSTPSKRRSRPPKDETLQVAEVESVRQQPSGPKHRGAPANTECEEKNADEKKQSTEENISKVLPIKLQAPKSSHRIHQSLKKQNEMSPFSKLYENLKQEMKVKKSLQEGNVSQQAAKEGGKRAPLEPRARVSSRGCVTDLGSLMKDREIGRSENTGECKITMRPEAVGSELNQSPAVGSATKKSFTKSPRTPVSKEGSRDAGRRSHLRDHKVISAAEKPKGTEVTPKASKENDGNATFLLKQCSIERLGYAGRTHSSAIALDKLAQTVTTTTVSEVDKYVLPAPVPTRKSPRSPLTPPNKEMGGMNPLNTDTSTAQRRTSLKRKSLTEISAETQREDSLSKTSSFNQLPLAEDKCLKHRRSSKQHRPGGPGKGEVLKESCDQANLGNSREGRSETPACPRRSTRRSKELPNQSVHSETLASEESTSELASPAAQKSESGRKRRGPRTSAQLTEAALETNIGQERDNTVTNSKERAAKEELAMEGHIQEQDLQDGSVRRPRRLSSKRSSGSPAVLKDDEAVSELNVSGLLAGEGSGRTRRVSQKRKSGDVPLQPSGKRKRVSFGDHLSLKLFDKSLPPNSPLKGVIPVRLSLLFGNSPPAVLKKAHLAAQELSEHVQKEKLSLKNLAAQKSPTALSPSPGKARSAFTSGSPAPYRKGRVSVSHLLTPLPIAEERDAGADDVNAKEKSGARVKMPKSPLLTQADTANLRATPDKSRRRSQLALKVTPMKRRSGAVAVINAKRRSGASSANLLVAKSWAEVVKLGVARPQSKTLKKRVPKGRSLKKITQSPKTPERKIKGHFSTGHAESPATIVVGRAYSTTVRTAGQVPKVVKNPILKLNMNMDESFTGMTEMFQTPEDKSGKSLLLATVEKTNFTPCSAAEISELHTPEEPGEMMVSPLNSSDASELKQDSPGICHSLIEKATLKSMFDPVSTKTPKKRKAVLEESISVDLLSVIPEKQACQVKSGSKRRTLKQKLEPVEVASGVKQLFRTPEQKVEPVEALSGIKQLVKTPKRKVEPAEDLSGIKQLMRTPKRKVEPVEDLSGIKQLMETPQQELEPVTGEGATKRLLKTPVQKRELVEDVAGDPVIKQTPRVKYQPVEDMIGVSRIFKTPKEKLEPIEDLFGFSRLVKTPKEKYQPVDDFVGLQRLMAEPRPKRPDFEGDYVGVKEMFDLPEEIKVRSGNGTDSKQDTAPPCTNSSQKLEDKGDISCAEDPQQKESTSEGQSTQRPTRGRSRKTVHPASAKQREKDLNLKAVQSLGNESTQEEMGEISTSRAIAENEGRGRRKNPCVQEEMVSEQPSQEQAETVSLLEPGGAPQRTRRGRRKKMQESEHPSENPENMKDALQERGIQAMLEAKGGSTVKAGSVSSSVQNEHCQLQTGIKKPESSDGGVGESETMLLSPGKRSRGAKEAENAEPLVLPRRGRRAKNDQVKEAPSEDLHRTTRRLRRGPAAEVIQHDEPASDKATETNTAEGSENGTKLEMKVTEKRADFLRRARKHSPEAKAGVCRVANEEKTKNIQKNEGTSAESDPETQSQAASEVKVSQGEETQNTGENPTEAPQRLKAESASGETNQAPVRTLRWGASRGAVPETNRTRSRRGKNGSLEKKPEEFARDVNSLELISPRLQSATEMEESSPRDSLSSVCVKDTHQVTNDQRDGAGASVPAADSDVPPRVPQKRTRNKQGTLKPNQTEIPQEDQASTTEIALRRGRSRKVTFEVEEAGSKRVGSLPTAENPSLQVRKSRRRQVDSVPQTACSTSTENQALISDHSEGEAFVEEQDKALEATPSAEDSALRRGRSREVAAASQTSRSRSLRRRGLLEGEDQKMSGREGPTAALGNKTVQAKANASGRGKRKKTLKEGEDTSLENPPQEQTRQLRNKKIKVEFSSEAATSTSSHKCGDLSRNSDASGTQNMCVTPTGSEDSDQSGKEEVNPVQRATSTSHGRKRRLPADAVLSKKLKSGKDENGSLQRGKRTEAKEELGEGAVRAARAAEGTGRRMTTRASARARKQP